MIKDFIILAIQIFESPEKENYPLKTGNWLRFGLFLSLKIILTCIG